jgi:uncharacterized protein
MSHDRVTDHNPSSNPSLESIVSARVTRRDILGGAGAVALVAGSSVMSGVANAGGGHGSRKLALTFNPVAKTLEDAVTLPDGYRYDVLFALGDPLSPKTREFSNDGTDDASSFASRAGDHHDGMYFFGMGTNRRYDPHVSVRGLLCINHEAITPAFLHARGQTIVNGVRTVAEEVRREFYVHGVSVIDVTRKTGRKVVWDYKKASPFNRRIHTLTPMKLTGPAGRTPYMTT